VTFNFTNAIRYNASLLVDGHVVDENAYACPDEGFACPGTGPSGDPYVTCGCPYTAWAQCALKQAASSFSTVRFITCWDDQGLAGQVQTNATLEAAASTCAGLASIDFDAVKTCNEDYDGERAALLFSAANRFMAKWPEYTNMNGPFHVPHVLIGANLNAMEDIVTNPNPINWKLCILDVQTGLCPVATTAAPTTTVAPVATTAAPATPASTLAPVTTTVAPATATTAAPTTTSGQAIFA